MRKVYILLSGLWLLFSLGCGNNEAQTKSDSTKSKVSTIQKDSTETKESPRVTFVELGSVNCIPCKAMQPIMKAVEEDYGDQIKVVFYDVRKDPELGRKFGIRLIPTQVFLDESGNEFYRHEGILSKENIDSLPVKRGLKIKTKSELEKS